MSGYYYLNDPEGDLGYTLVSEDEIVGAILSIAKSYGVNIKEN